MKTNTKTNTKAKATKKVKVTSTKAKIVNIINTHDNLKNAYFMKADKRNNNLNFYNELKFKFNNDNYEVHQSCVCSCKNVYYNCAIYVNDVKKDIRVLKAIV